MVDKVHFEEYGNGTKRWFVYDDRTGKQILHRFFGPALINEHGVKCWYYMGIRHRTDGPAVEFPDDGKVHFFFEGRELEMGVWFKYANVNDEMRTLLTLEYGGRCAEKNDYITRSFS